MSRSLLIVLICINTLLPLTLAAKNGDSPHAHDTDTPPNIAKIDFILDKKQITNPKHLEQLEALIHISVGAPFSRYAIQQSVIALYSQQTYSKIDVFTDNTVHGKTLVFHMQTVMKIKEISITGIAAAELKRSIQNGLKVKHGDRYFHEIEKTDLQMIKQVCANRGYFDAQVEAKTDTTHGRLTYQILLGDSTAVAAFQIHGNSAISTKHLKAACHTHIGKIYTKSTIHEDFIAIRARYRKRHYPHIKIHDDFDPQSGTLTYNIQEGKQLLLDFVDVHGKPLLQKPFIRRLFANLQRTREESERNQLRRKIERYINTPPRWAAIVQTHYQQKGYYGTEVKATTLTNDPLHVEFTIKPGNRYTVKSVEITGNKAFTRTELLREMETKPRSIPAQVMKRRYFSELTFQKDKNRLKVLYEKSGYPHVQISSAIERHQATDGKDGEVSIKLNIREPHKEIIYRCLFQGNHALADNTLYSVLPNQLPQPNAKLLQKNYENAILKAYQERGYIDAKVVETYFQKYDTPTFEIPGDFTEKLDVGPLPPAIEDVFKKHQLSLTDMHIATRVEEEWSIQDFQGNARYSLLQQHDRLAVYEHGILQFTIVEGDQIAFGQFNFNGDVDVIPHILHREVAHLTGTLFTPDKLNQARQNIYNTRIFEPGITYRRSISINTQQRDNRLPDSTVVNDVSFNLQKRMPGTYGASIGLSSTNGPRGTLSLSHLNLFRRNIRFQLRGRLGFRVYLYETTLTEPWLLGRTSGSLQLLARRLEADDGVRALQASLRLGRKLPGEHLLNLEYGYRHLKDTFLHPTDPVLSTTVSSVRFLWRQNTQFPALNPTTGALNEITLEYAGGIFGGRSRFIKTIARTINHQQLHRPDYVVSTSLRLGLTTGLQRDNASELISFERFWAGGATTVRGYQERGLGPEDTTGKYRGNVLLIFNTELRFTLIDPIQGILFLDSGNVWGSVSEIDYGWMPTSVGVGLRIILGPLIGGVDYAVPLIAVPGVPTNSLYFRIGSTF